MRKFMQLSALLLALSCLFALGCSSSDDEKKDDNNPITPSESTLQSYVGTWNLLGCVSEAKDDVTYIPNGYISIDIDKVGTVYTFSCVSLNNEIIESFTGTVTLLDDNGTKNLVIRNETEVLGMFIVDSLTDKVLNLHYPLGGSLKLIKSTTVGVYGYVITNDDAPIVNATVLLQQGTAQKTATTDNCGHYFFENIATTEATTLSASASEYVSQSHTILVNSAAPTFENFTLEAEQSGPDPLAEISLSWNSESTADIDLCALTPERNGEATRINYSNRGSLSEFPYMYHNGDARNGSNAPELISVSPLIVSDTYTIYAHIYNGHNFMSESATVFFKGSDGEPLASTSASNYGLDFHYWTIATVTNGEVTIVNSYGDTAPGEEQQTHPEVTKIELLWPSTLEYDLDLIATTPFIGGQRYRVGYSARGSLYTAPYMLHDGDDLGNHGDESIEVNQLCDGVYDIYVKNNESVELQSTGGCIVLHGPSSEIQRIYSCNAIGNQRYWHVAQINGSTNEITVINLTVSSIPSVN